MSISSLSRPSFSSPRPSLVGAEQPASRAGCAKAVAPRSPVNDVRQQLMTDSFEPASKKLGTGAGGIEKTLEQMSQVLGEVMQLMQSLGMQPQGLLGNTGGTEAASPAAPSGVARAANAPSAPALANAPSAPSLASASSAPVSSKSSSDAGPGFGAHSAGSTEKVDPSQPWLARNNVGAPYNSNMQLIDPGQKGQFKFTNTFKNTTNEPQTITLWNKTGENGNPNDGQHFDKSKPKTFTLQPGQSQMVAFDSNTSVAWCVSKDGSSKAGANYGQTWGEATFANGATGWSGYDTSQISPAGHQGRMSIRNEANGHTVTEANAWQTPSDDPAGRDVGVPAGPLHLSTTLG
ncbi:hypothetical protein LZ198_03420 [Myxococcus sp. K15C18031901]|uniref:hypothetical protein n=1 Tax=Myxococcus dinghuensis TaxID=2906761 RepID=UPI0020A7E988|nr:hypothetical protein [Myxococcus dinghuensis]MCP3097921.1 hypothetical protein [Myxococcus dinghuensis]